MNVATAPQTIDSNLDCLTYLQHPDYQRYILTLPAEQQAIKKRLLPAFIKLLDSIKTKNYTEVNQLTQTLLKAATAHPEIFLTLAKISLDVIEEPAKAKQMLEPYTKLLPRDKNGWLLYAESLFRLASYKEALDAAKQAQASDKQDPQCYVLLGKISHNMRNYRAAKKYNQDGLKYDPNNTILLSNYGAALQFMGERDSADKFYKEALKKNPLAFFAYDGLTYSSDNLKDDSDFIHAAEKALEKVSPNANGIESLYFCLGRYYHKLKDYDKAWGYLTKFHTLRLNELGYRPEQRIRNQSAIVEEAFTKEYLAKSDLPRAITKNEASPIFIVGMPRSGTTLTEQILHSHSKVTGRGEMRELMAICSHMHSTFNLPHKYPHAATLLNEKQLTILANHYLSALIPANGKSLYYVDKNPFNYSALGTIYQLFPKAKIIHCVRNPMDTCLSIYENKFSSNHFWMHSPTDIGLYYREYRKLMDHWKETLPSPIHTVKYESLIENQESETRALLEYIGLEWEDSCLSFHENNRVADTVSIYQVSKPIYKSSDGKWQKYASQLQPFVDTIGKYAELY